MISDPSLVLRKLLGRNCTHFDFPSQKYKHSQASQLRCCQVMPETSIQAQLRPIPHSKPFVRNTVHDTALYLQPRGRSMCHQQRPHVYKRQPSRGRCNTRWDDLIEEADFPVPTKLFGGMHKVHGYTEDVKTSAPRSPVAPPRRLGRLPGALDNGLLCI